MTYSNNNELPDKLKNNFVYAMLTTIADLMDKKFLDPILGLIFPGFGDTLLFLLVIPYLYVSIFKLKSLALSLAIILNMLIDIMVGLIPYGIGDLADIFHRSYSKNLRLIEGFARGDREVIREVNRKAWLTALLIAVSCVVIFLLIKLTVTLLTSGYDLITSMFS